MPITQSIDNAITWVYSRFNKKAAAKRAHFQRMEKDEEYARYWGAILSARGYRAASTGRNGGAWLNARGGSGDDELAHDRMALVMRSRELEQDDSLGQGIGKTFVSNILGGHGITPQATTDDDEKNERMEAFWARRSAELFSAENEPLCETQAKLVTRRFYDGEIYLVKSSNQGKLFYEIVETDRAATPVDKIRLNIIDGIEKDTAGIPVKYYFKKKPNAMKSEDFAEVEARRVLHWKLSRRAGQTHGLPALHACMQDLRDLDLLILASIKRVQVAACLAVFIKSEVELDEIIDATAKKYGYEMDQAINPGMIFKLAPNEEIQTLIPNFPVPEFVPFIEMIAKKIGASIGITWQMVLKTFAGANYSSARTDILEARPLFQQWQQSFTAAILNPIWLAVMEDGILTGELEGAKIEEAAMVSWLPSGWEWVDPTKEAQAAQLGLIEGWLTLRDVCARQGKDWKDQKRQMLKEEAFENEERKRMNLPIEQPAQAKQEYRKALRETFFMHRDDDGRIREITRNAV